MFLGACLSIVFSSSSSYIRLDSTAPYADHFILDRAIIMLAGCNAKSSLYDDPIPDRLKR